MNSTGRSNNVDHSEFNYADNTFKTGYDDSVPTSFERVELKLPNVVNFVALRETFLSEAPFVTRTNRGFWKKWIDSKQYINVLAASLSFVSDCIGENGSVNMARLNDISDNFYMEQMSTNVSEMMLVNKSKHSGSLDLLFRKLPELLCYMIVNSLQSCSPRNARIYNSRGFREILLDWIGELIGGIRITNCRKDRDWLFSDANEATVVVTNGNMPLGSGGVGTGTVGSRRSTPQQRGMTRNMSASPLNANATNNTAASTLPAINNNLSGGESTSSINTSQNSKSAPHLSCAVSQFSINNSPLINVYLNLGRGPRESPYACLHSVKVKLTHLPDRPITTIRPETLLTEGKFREVKVMDDYQLRQAMRQSVTNRRSILSQHEASKKSTQEDIKRLRESFNMQMTALSSGGAKQLTNKQLLAAAALDTAVAEKNAD